MSSFSFNNNNNRPASNTFGSNNTGFGQQRPTQSAFGQSTFGNSTFGQTQQQPGGFGQPQTSGFGSTNSAFGRPATTGFGGTSTFGQPAQTGGFGSTTSTFGQPQQNTGFGGNNTFGQPSNTGFGQTTSGFGQPSTTGFGSTTTSGFGQNNTSGFGQPTTTGFGQSSTAGFGQTNTTGFGSTSNTGFGQANTGGFGGFGAAKPSFGGTLGQNTQPSFGGFNTGGMGINEGTKPNWNPTSTSDGYYQTITADKQYENFSLEELRVKDYQLNKKSGPSATGFGGFTNPSTTTGFGQTNTSSFNQPSTFGAPTNTNTFQSTAPSFGGFGSTSNTNTTTGFGTSNTTSAFGQKPAFGQTATNTFSTPGFGQGATSNTTTGFGQQPQQSGFGTNSSFNQPSTTLGNTSGFGQTTTAPSFGTGTSTFGQTQPAATSGFQSNAFNNSLNKPTFGTPTPSFGQSNTNTFSTPNQPPKLQFGTNNTTATTQPTTSFNVPTTQPSFGGFNTQKPAFSLGQPSQPTSFQPQNQQNPVTPDNKLVARVDQMPYGNSPLLDTPIKQSPNLRREKKSERLPASIKRQPQVSSRYKSTVIFSPQKRMQDPHSVSEDAKLSNNLNVTMDMFKSSPKALHLTPEAKSKLKLIESVDMQTPTKPMASTKKNVEPESPITHPKSSFPIEDPKIKLPENLIITPPIQEIAENMAKAPNYKVPNLNIRVPGVGMINFTKPVDLMNPVSDKYEDEYSGLRLSELLTKIFNELIQIKDREIIVYPEDDYTPEEGSGLNVPILVTMESIWPRDRQTKKEIRDTEHELYKKYELKLKNLNIQRYVSYENGVWVYQLDHL
eukprot:NODE_364_length_8749_cov_0.472254.p1 type:complete len:834 gc:universal NODE_364_length_8749_cov_0.472254:6718-4217(-)